MPDPRAALPADLAAAIERSGYYPALVGDSVRRVLGAEQVDASLVHQETTLDESMRLHRHVTVLVLTPGRLLVVHVDEHAPTEEAPNGAASTSAESVPLSRLGPVTVTTLVTDPAAYRAGTVPEEVTLTVEWGTQTRVDLPPADCGDERCEADHGYAGTLLADDLSLRVSAAGDGPGAVDGALLFAAALTRPPGGYSR